MITAKRLRSVLVVTASLLGLSAMPAQADIGDVWAFAYNDKPTPGAFFVPMDPSHQWSKFGGANAEVRSLGIGRYEVRFAKTANKVGISHVTAVSAKPRYCQLASWRPNFADGYEYVRVDCYRHGGFREDTEFTVMFTGSSGSTPVGDKHAYIFSSATGLILDEFNPEGPDIVSHGGPGSGVYKVHLPMSSFPPDTGNFQVTAVGPKPARCKISEWHPDFAGQTVIVSCFNHDSKPYDTAWTLSYNRERPVIGEYGPPKRFGYVLITPALPPGTNFNSLLGAGANSVTFGSGQYYVVLPEVGVRENHVQVTAFGDGPAYCGLQTLWTEDFFGNAHVRNVICFDELGDLAKTDSFMAYTSRH